MGRGVVVVVVVVVVVLVVVLFVVEGSSYNSFLSPLRYVFISE